MKTITRLSLLTLALCAPLAQAASLTVSAAASLTDAFRDIAALYQKAHPEHEILFNFAGSGVLLQQIKNGAPVDVFASADLFTMDEAEQAGLIADGSRQSFVSNALVVIVPNDSTLKINIISDLQNDAIQRIALANPEHVPVGRYSKAALERAELWTALESKMIGTQNVRQSLDYVSRAEVDAGFVYATDAATKDNVRIVVEIPTETPLHYPIGVVKASENQALALEFIDFVTSEAGMDVLERYGFGAIAGE